MFSVIPNFSLILQVFCIGLHSCNDTSREAFYPFEGRFDECLEGVDQDQSEDINSIIVLKASLCTFVEKNDLFSMK